MLLVQTFENNVSVILTPGSYALSSTASTFAGFMIEITTVTKAWGLGRPSYEGASPAYGYVFAVELDFQFIFIHFMSLLYQQPLHKLGYLALLAMVTMPSLLSTSSGWSRTLSVRIAISSMSLKYS